MNHQITLIGGQILPVYLGIKEKSPDVVHVLYSKDSKNQFTLLNKSLPGVKFESYQIDPFDFENIREKTEEIILSHTDKQFELNLTGGTKIMALASQHVFNTLGLSTFYIDQKHGLFSLKEKSKAQITTSIKLETFLKLTGHSKFNLGKLSDYTAEEKRLSNAILTVCGKGWHRQIVYKLHSTGNFKAPNSFTFKDKGNQVTWDGKKLNIAADGLNDSFTTSKGLSIAFSGLWWEILIAQAVASWKPAMEAFMGLEIYSKTEGNIKNEIDVILNTGKNLIFMECKSGNVSQEDLNKISAVAELYGGTSCRSILVCRVQPAQRLLEKCAELDIDVFSYQKASGNKHSKPKIHTFTSLNDLPKRLDYLLTKMHL